MKASNKMISLQSYAFRLRKQLITGCPLESLLSQHKHHQKVLANYTPRIKPEELSFGDRFAWKFMREVNILNTSFLENSVSDSQSRGVYQDLAAIVDKVRSIWFPHMETPPNSVWLKHFSTRKLAHYAKTKDEIAFSLIFDFADSPPEILSYLAYHELLHRQVGVKEVNGRRYHHTGEFKSKEQLFPNWRSIEKQISEYIVNTI
jgi:predicted metal-dependent hydrolase